MFMADEDIYSKTTKEYPDYAIKQGKKTMERKGAKKTFKSFAELKEYQNGESR